ncbi:unnamed protein product [Allacma fusca]|uniref:G-patch domain-containing protein n=1 Tax=Allacma fusca TaxID=39272 RepID=A0A8J2Q1D9_9HEXA|nr:unnamed protein product [Allacma fusca]
MESKGSESCTSVSVVGGDQNKGNSIAFTSDIDHNSSVIKRSPSVRNMEAKLWRRRPPIRSRNYVVSSDLIVKTGQGNVGTKNSYFLELIRQCRLPPSLIQKLGLQFPRARRYKKYSKVPFNYKTTVAGVETKEEDDEIVTGKGHVISDVYVDNSTSTLAKGGNGKASREESDESGPDDDDDRCEDWERHVTFEDDPTTQERIKERLFEDEIELVWEKGGPGIVWYTDAQFWNEQRGGFDEKTADNLDVDMEGYFTPGEGDKDARDMLDMRRNNRFHKGLDDDSVFKRPALKPKTLKPKIISVGDNGSTTIGEFEKHTRGIGRKVMEKFGWKEGTGLGKSFVGMTEALYNEGQAPRDKRGIGFYGDNIEFKRQKKDHLPEPYDDEHRVSIGTIYDKPTDLDTEEPLLRSSSISYIKRYQ